MQIEVVPLTDFDHGGRPFTEGKPAQVHEADANDLEKAGLVRVKMSPAHQNKMMPPATTKARDTPAGKAPADGEATPSASLRPARVSPPKTAKVSMRGAAPRRKADT